MPTTVEEQITQDIVDCLTAVARSAGDSFDVIAEHPDPAEGNRERDGLFVVTPGDAVKLSSYSTIQRWSKSYEVVGTVKVSEAFVDQIGQALSRLAADAINALTGDEATRRRNGARAEWTEIDPVSQKIDDANAKGTLTLTVTVTYQTLRTNHYVNPFAA